MPLWNRQYIGASIGGGVDINPRIGGGLNFIPYAWRHFDIVLSLDYSYMFKGDYHYSNDPPPADIYTYSDVQQLVPYMLFRYVSRHNVCFQIGGGWAFSLNQPTISHMSGPDSNRTSVNNTVLGGYRASFGAAFRIGKKDCDCPTFE